MEHRPDDMAKSWAHPVGVAVWMALHGIGRPASASEIGAALGWLDRTVEPVLARLLFAGFVGKGPRRDGRMTWEVTADLRRSLAAYGVRPW